MQFALIKTFMIFTIMFKKKEKKNEQTIFNLHYHFMHQII